MPPMSVNPSLLEMMAKEGLLSLTQAAQELNTSPQKIKQLISKGLLTTRTHPLDARLKLVPKAEVEELKKLHPPTPSRTKKKK